MAKSVHVWRHFSKSDIPKQIETSSGIFDLITYFCYLVMTIV